MNELRKNISRISLRLPDNAITRYYTLGDEEIDTIIDAVIAALPAEHPDSWQSNPPQVSYELGRREYRKEILTVLQKAKGESQ